MQNLPTSLYAWWCWCLWFLCVYNGCLVEGQRGTSIHWPMAFIAKGHADDWNASSIVYYDWRQQAMRRDTFLVFPPSHFNPETNSVELTKQPTMASFIWKDVHFPTLPFHAFHYVQGCAINLIQHPCRRNCIYCIQRQRTDGGKGSA